MGRRKNSSKISAAEYCVYAVMILVFICSIISHFWEEYQKKLDEEEMRSDPRRTEPFSTFLQKTQVPEEIVIEQTSETFDESEEIVAEETLQTFEILLSDEEQNAPIEENSIETESAASSNLQNTRVNINTADLEELMTLKGIGEVKAQAIIDYRTEYGSFNSVDELINVSGIGEKTLDNLRDYITV